MPCDWLRTSVLSLGIALAIAPAARSQQPAQDEAAQQQGQPGETPIDRWNRMTPEERERELAKLPPARARMIRQQLRRYNQLRPEEKEKLRERYQTFAQLPPNLRQLVRQRLQQFRQLPVARQGAVHREVVELRTLPEDQRAARLESEDMRSRFSPEERQIIQDLANYLDIKK